MTTTKRPGLKLTRPVLAGLILASTSAQAVYISDGSGYLYDLDANTNTATAIGDSGTAMFDIALNPLTNTLYGVGNNGQQLYSIDTSTGAATSIGLTMAFINGLTFDSSGTLYGTGGSGLYTLDLGSGGASLIGDTGYNSSGDIAFDADGNLFMSSSNGGDSLIQLDVSSGSGTMIGSIGFAEVYGLNYANSQMYGFTYDGATISIDTTTGAGTLLGYNQIRTYGADGSGGVISVSEPSILALLGVGLLGLLGTARRNKRS